jgi:hypothetical protein
MSVNVDTKRGVLEENRVEDYPRRDAKCEENILCG